MQIHARILTAIHLSRNANRGPCAELATTLILAFCLPANDYSRRLISTLHSGKMQIQEQLQGIVLETRRVHCSNLDMLRRRSVKSSYELIPKPGVVPEALTGTAFPGIMGLS